MSSAENKTVIEKFMLTSRGWAEGYRMFNKQFGKPLGWLYLFQDVKNKLVRLDQKGHCSFFAHSAENESGCVTFLLKYFDQLKSDAGKINRLPYDYKCAYGRSGLVFALEYLNQLKGFLVLCATKKAVKNVNASVQSFQHFVRSQVELAYKNFELQNFYETIHPRALALSTMHSVHRAISSSLHLHELLPRIGRLCAQILKAEGCDIYLMDEDQKYLVPHFSLYGNRDKIRKSRMKVGRGIEGHVAQTAEFHFSRRLISVPLIEEDVIGVIALRDKIGGSPFTKMDMEILKTLSEQGVVAIKNAKLFEETERLTVGSIQAINELLELSYGRSTWEMPLLSELVFEIGKDLHLSSSELTNLHRATFLIDAGHMGTPERILRKKTRLTKVEFAQIKRHPHLGAAVIKKMGPLKPVIPIILYHHERYDGKGYPEGLKMDEIPVGARVVSVADSFLAMISDRPYRTARRISEAIQEIKVNSGSQFDPQVVASFMRVVEKAEMMKKIIRFEKMCGQSKTKREFSTALRGGSRKALI